MFSDEGARFEALYRQHFTRVLGYALGRLEPERAKDATAETFLVAWRRLGDVPDDPVGWLLGVARKVVADQLRAGARQATASANGSPSLTVAATDLTGAALQFGDQIVFLEGDDESAASQAPAQRRMKDPSPSILADAINAALTAGIYGSHWQLAITARERGTSGV